MGLAELRLDALLRAVDMSKERGQRNRDLFIGWVAEMKSKESPNWLDYWHGDTELLMFLDVVPPNFGEKLECKNGQGEPILVCRHWWVQSKQFDVESPSIRAAILL